MAETFQSLLSAVMRRNHLSQRALAKKAGVDHVALCRILKETYAFKPSRVIGRLVEAVGCTAYERIELYRLAGVIPPEVVKAFCSSHNFAKAMVDVAKRVEVI